ncbi:MAG: ribosomal protein S18-alanine N-acetyltransferase [Acidobacteriota bacterium]|nr:ribosomal protein S18-alanine N-acetyltransferase [Acidobacteriota bacterium]
MSITEQAATAATAVVSISKMTEHDLLEVVEIEENSGLSRWGWTAYYAELQGSNSDLMLVARLDNPDGERRSQSVAGYIVARMGAEELHINNVAVRDKYRRRGIGRVLLNRILEAGSHRGARCAFLELRAGNTAAQALYEECGFRLTARRQRYYSDPVEDALVMIAGFERSA